MVITKGPGRLEHCCECGSTQETFDTIQHDAYCAGIAREQEWAKPCDICVEIRRVVIAEAMYGEPWRVLESVDRFDFLAEMARLNGERQTVGRREYGERYDSEEPPIDAAIRSTLNTLFYLWMEKRRHDATMPSV